MRAGSSSKADYASKSEQGSTDGEAEPEKLDLSAPGLQDVIFRQWSSHDTSSYGSAGEGGSAGMLSLTLWLGFFHLRILNVCCPQAATWSVMNGALLHVQMRRRRMMGIRMMAMPPGTRALRLQQHTGTPCCASIGSSWKRKRGQRRDD